MYIYIYIHKFIYILCALLGMLIKLRGRARTTEHSEREATMRTAVGPGVADGGELAVAVFEMVRILSMSLGDNPHARPQLFGVKRRFIPLVLTSGCRHQVLQAMAVGP